MAEAEAELGLVGSVATLIDLWYVTQTPKAVTATQLAMLGDRLASSDAVTVEPVTLTIGNATTTISRDILADPWDRLIVASAMVLEIPLVSRDEASQRSGLVPTIW